MISDSDRSSAVSSLPILDSGKGWQIEGYPNSHLEIRMDYDFVLFNGPEKFIGFREEVMFKLDTDSYHEWFDFVRNQLVMQFIYGRKSHV